MSKLWKMFREWKITAVFAKYDDIHDFCEKSMS